MKQITEYSFKWACIICLFLASFSFCAIAPNHGLFYTNVSYPGEFNSDNDVLDRKEGIGCQTQYLGLVSIGDASAGAVAREFAITKISTIDYSFTGIAFPVYGKFCILVRGE